MSEPKYLIMTKPKCYTVKDLNQLLTKLRAQYGGHSIGSVIIQVHPVTTWYLDRHYRFDDGDIANHGKEVFPFA